MDRMVSCLKLGKEAPGLDYIPLPGELGQRIYDHVSKEAWEMWMDYQTRLINEYRLNLAESESRDFVMQWMEHFFFGRQKAESKESSLDL